LRKMNHKRSYLLFLGMLILGYATSLPGLEPAAPAYSLDQLLRRVRHHNLLLMLVMYKKFYKT
jgi:hypothetical protein